VLWVKHSGRRLVKGIPGRLEPGWRREKGEGRREKGGGRREQGVGGWRRETRDGGNER
jgi:hypothetical protein